ncbi:septum site-determining protein minD [Striga asiatica]|uniref:Septum site-determining protein minD n=1 Tax=Striga asiatica TaxID=4170 RepID=A0A5A7RGH6_STRAF|nr:septum site-determining protein minD [Striga asiatica]
MDKFGSHYFVEHEISRNDITLKATYDQVVSTFQWRLNITTKAPRVKWFNEYPIKPITSGKGDKTSTTTNIHLSLVRLCFFTVAIDADVGLSNPDLLLGLENRIKYTVVEVLNVDDPRLGEEEFGLGGFGLFFFDFPNFGSTTRRRLWIRSAGTICTRCNSRQAPARARA